MAIDWEQFSNQLDGVISGAAQATDDELASQISSLTTMTDAQVNELFPTPADKQKLAKLMKIVKSADDRNAKINRIASSAEDFAGVILTLAGKFV